MAKTSHSHVFSWRRVDKTLPPSGQDYRTIFESIGCAIIGLSLKHRILHWNAEAERIYGYTRDEVLGRDYFELFLPKGVHEAVAADIRKVLAGEPTYGLETSVRLRDGSERDLIWSVRRQLDDHNRPIGVIVCGQDITERDQSRSRLYVTDLALANGMPAISRLDARGRFVEVNESYARMLGSEPNELMGLSWKGTVHPGDFTRVGKAHQKMLKLGQVEFEARGVRKDGSSFVKQVLLVKIESAAGEFVGHHCFMRDVTEQKREAALKSAHKHVLDLLCKETPLNNILSDLVRSVESQIEGIACTILLFDRQTQSLKLGVGPGLPKGYLEAIDGMSVGPKATPCGLVAHINQEVTIENILTDPRCKPAVPLAKRYGLRSCRPMPIRDQNGDVLGVFSLYLTGDNWPPDSDMQWIRAAVSLSGLVIERQKTREILRENEAVFQSLAETVQVIPWEMDLQTTRFTYVGAQAEQILGYANDSDDWYSGSFWGENIHPDDRQHVIEFFSASIPEKDDFSCDFRVKTSTGHDRWFHCVVHVERVEHRPDKLRGYMIDITRRKLAEDSAKRMNQLLNVLTRAQTQFISDVNPRKLFDELQRNLLTLTSSQYGFIGEVLHTPEGQPYLKTQAITDIAWNDETRGFYDKHAPQGMEFFNLETLFGEVMTSGKPVIANSPATDPRGGGTPAGHPLLESFLGLPFHRGNRLVGMIGMANRPGGYDQALVAYLEPVLATCGSIIEAYQNDQRRRTAEAALAEAHQNLEKRVRQRTADLTLANAQLQQRQNELAHVSRLSTMGEMATGLAHEINQPLHAISNYAEGALVRIETGDLEADELRHALKQISADAERAGEIIRRLRRFVGKYAPRRSSVNVNYLVRDAINMIDFEANRLGVSIHLRLAERLPLLFADSVQIEQVILNLLRNSFQAMEADQPSSRVVVIETSCIAKDAIQVAVRDSGRGFQDIAMQSIFEAFYTTKEDGLGMGLTISRSIIEAHGGRLWAESNPDRGVTFLFTLPISSGKPEHECT